MKNDIKAYVLFHFPVKLVERKKWYVASCPILDICSQGRTKEEAKKNLQEAISLFFESCIERRTINAVLEATGIELAVSGSLKAPRTPRRGPENSVDVPMFLLPGKHREEECRA